MLDAYRRSFRDAYETVVRTAREQLLLEPTGRSAKSTSSIIEKLRRESIRLGQVQDIAGCRIVVSDVLEQDRAVNSLCGVFSGASVVDRRANPSYGYRAVHVIVPVSGKAIEIQVRTRLQHLWAELSEKYADILDLSIKYGGGPRVIRQGLADTSDFVARYENRETTLRVDQEVSRSEQELKERQAILAAYREELVQILAAGINALESIKRPRS
jgi:putative GTP pyrophosphokinase